MLMDYPLALDTLSKLTNNRRNHSSLQEIKALCKHFSHPEKTFPAVHVAGTNGKGSTCIKIAKALSLKGYRVGVYTSPHILSPRERISIGKELISKKSFARIFSSILSAFPGCSFFEMMTMLAFLYFKEQKIDVAILETGLGGEFDPTNVCSSILSIITSISYDHVEVLGNSLSSIAKAKAGIIKEHVPVLLGASANLQEIIDKANTLSSPLHFSTNSDADYEKQNRHLAEKALYLLDELFPTTAENKKEGVLETPPCRFEIASKNPLIILDAAHNEEGIKALLQKLDKSYPKRRYKLLLAFSKGKDLSRYPALFSPIKHSIYLLDSTDPKLEKASFVQELFAYPTRVLPSVSSFIEEGKDPNDLLVIAGSFFLMEKAKEILASSAIL